MENLCVFKYIIPMRNYKIIVLFILFLLSICNDVNAEKIIWDYSNDVDSIINVGDRIRHNNPDSAILIYNSALSLIDTVNDKHNLAKIYTNIGSSYHIKGDYEKAMSLFFAAQSIWQQINNTQGIANSYNNIGVLYTVLDYYDKAIDCHRKGLRLSDSVSDSMMVYKNNFNLTIVFINKQNLDSAMLYTAKTLELVKMLNDKSEYLKTCNLAGRVYGSLGLVDSAQYFFNQVVINDDVINEWELGYAYAGIADLELKLNRPNIAIEWAKKSMFIAKKLDAKWDVQHSAQILYKAYEKIGNNVESFKYYKIYNEYSDIVFSEKKARQIDYLELKKKDFENRLLINENILINEKISKKNHIIIFLVIISILVVILVFLLMKNISRIRALNNDLEISSNEINDKNKQLSVLLSVKDRFFGIIGHDVKSPVSTVVSFVELLKNNYDQFNRDDIIEYLDIISTSGLNAIDLLDTILDWSKSQMGDFIPDPHVINIREVINTAVGFVGNITLNKGIEIIIDEKCSFDVNIDKNMNTTILRNLLTNAAKFSHSGSKVYIFANRHDDKLRISVKDKGVGMSKERISELFDLTKRNTSLGTKNEKGTGIGLVLCKELVEKQGGKIWVESEEGKGSVFVYELGMI